MAELKPSPRDVRVLNALRRLIGLSALPLRQSDMVLVPPLATGGLIKNPRPLISGQGPPHHPIPQRIIPRLPMFEGDVMPPRDGQSGNAAWIDRLRRETRAKVADRIHADRHYVDDHPATPDTFWAGMRHAEQIAREER